MNPALTYDPNLATVYLLESWSSAGGLLRMSTITGAVGSEVLTTGVAFPTGPQPWQAVEPTINFAPQLGSIELIDTDDDRLDWTVYRIEYLYHQVSLRIILTTRIVRKPLTGLHFLRYTHYRSNQIVSLRFIVSQPFNGTPNGTPNEKATN